MIKPVLIIALLTVSNVLFAQDNDEIAQFNKNLNQFLNVRDFSISEDGDEAFFTIQSPGMELSQLATIRKENNEWSEPELLPFCDSYKYLEPFLSTDGDRLFFASDRPLTDSTSEKKDFDIWYVDRNNSNDGWSEPKNIGKPINSDLNEFYPAVSKNNNMYFTLDSPDGLGKDDIYFSKWESGTYLPPVLLSEQINSSGYEFNAFISQNEDFILFSRYNTEDGQGSGDLYISRKDEAGNWKKATNVEVPINTKYMEYCPFYDEKNQVLYFTSRRNAISTRDFKSISDFKNYVQESANGLSKIYMTPIKLDSLGLPRSQ